MEIAPGIHTIPADSASIMGMYAPNVYLVAAKRAAMIDTGYPHTDMVRARLDYIEGLSPLELDYILVTHPHPDHIGGCRKIREATGAKVAVHSLTAEQSERYQVTADIHVSEGDIIDLGGLSVEVVQTPGHTPDSVCFYVREDRALFTGDHIIGFGTPVVTSEGDLGQYLDSLRKLLSYELRLICPGHGPLIREPRRKINEIIAHRREREEQVLRCLKHGCRTVMELVRDIYPELDPGLTALAKEQLLAHLKKLVKEGRVKSRGEHYTLARAL